MEPSPRLIEILRKINPSERVRTTITKMAQRRHVLKNRPEHIEGDLYQGFVPFSIKSTEDFRYATTGRSVCDCILLLVQHPDGSTDGILSHFLPTLGSRTGHAALLEKNDIQINPEDKTFALILSTTIPDESGDNGFEKLKAAVAKKNNGIEPDIKLFEMYNSSDIVFTQKAGTDGYVQTVEVTNSDYNKKFTFTKTGNSVPRA